jgi:hypothetical protein
MWLQSGVHLEFNATAIDETACPPRPYTERYSGPLRGSGAMIQGFGRYNFTSTFKDIAGPIYPVNAGNNANVTSFGFQSPELPFSLTFQLYHVGKLDWTDSAGGGTWNSQAFAGGADGSIDGSLLERVPDTTAGQ